MGSKEDTKKIRTCSEYCQRVDERVRYRKPFSRSHAKTQLSKCLTTWDLVGYGIAAMIGSSIFILTGTVMRNRAGPATFLCYLIAGIVALPNSLAYSDLSCRIPKAGSIYVYAYVIVSEMVAFFAGWAVLLEYIIATATTARGCSGMIDVMSGGEMSRLLINAFGKLNSSSNVLADYLDPFGSLLIIAIAILSCFGIKSSAWFTQLLVGLNFIVVIIITIFMFVFADVANLTIKPPANYTITDPLLSLQFFPDGPGFLPFGVTGLLAGAATCFNSFIGFDVISTCAEETEHPGKSLPRANIISVVVVSITLGLCALSLTLYAPWYIVTANAPFHSALILSNKGTFSERMGMFYFVGVGAIISIISCLLGNLIAASRILYGMAEDRLIFSLFNKVCQPFKSPVFATTLVALISLFLTLIFSIESLADFLSLGTLFAYSLASLAVMKYRYCDPLDADDGFDKNSEVGLHYGEFSSESDTESLTKNEDFSLNLDPYWARKLPKKWAIKLDRDFERGSVPMMALGTFLILAACFVVTLALPNVGNLEFASAPRILFTCLFVFGMALCVAVLAIHRQKVTLDPELYQLPMVPYLPCVSVIFNFLLISQLSWLTWVRFVLWILLGFIVYFGYAMFQDKPTSPSTSSSGENQTSDEKKQSFTDSQLEIPQ